MNRCRSGAWAPLRLLAGIAPQALSSLIGAMFGSFMHLHQVRTLQSRTPRTFIMPDREGYDLGEIKLPAAMTILATARDPADGIPTAPGVDSP